MKEKLNILILSSRLPSHSADCGRDVIASLSQAGHHVQFGFDGIEEYIGECTKPLEMTLWKKAYYRIHYYLRKYFKSWICLFPPISMWAKDETVIFHPYENKPPLSEKILIDKLKGEYDICVVLFYHNMFTTKTYKAIYDKFHIPFIFKGTDMMPITGGCYYSGNCRNFEHECGCCPVMGGNDPNDQTHKNFLYKRKVYDSIECVFWGNRWMLDHARRSHLFDNAKMQLMGLVLDENEYTPRDTLVCRRKLNIPDNKQYIFLSRYRKLARKGMDILVDGMNRLYDSLPDEKRNKILLVLIGEKADNLSDIFKMDVLQLGFLNKSGLIDAYNASTAFLCSSIEDAGPSMINQSMACATPVVAFDAGCSVDMIDDGVNGFKVPVSEKERWYEGMKKICAMSENEYAELSRQARKKAVELNGLRAFSKAVEDVYLEFRPNGKK